MYDRGPSASNRTIIRKLILVLAVLGFMGVCLLFTLGSAMKTVPTGTKGVLLTWGRVDRTVDEGLNWVVPIAQEIILMDVTIQKAESAEDTGTLDLQSVSTTIAVNYKLDERYVKEIWATFRKEYEMRVIKPNIEESIKAVTAKFRAEELITRRAEVNDLFKKTLSERLDDHHIIVIQVSVTNFQFSTEFDRAIEAKVTAEQQALEAKNILERIRYEAQQKIIQAEAQANATVTKATAEARAIEIINEQLYKSPLYLQYQAIEKWDGKLPYFVGSDAIPFIAIQPPQEPS